MLTGLDILLDRMKTNPEEFLNEIGNVPYEGEAFGGKWSDLLSYAWRVANEEERQVLDDARKEFYRDDFNERVMRRLAGEEQEQRPETKTYPHLRAQQQMHPLQNSAQNLALQGGTVTQQHWTDPTISSMFGQAQVRQEGAAIGVDPSFWGGVVASGKGKLW